MSERGRYALPMTLMEQAVAEQLAGEAPEPADGGAPPLHLPDLYIEGFRGIDLLEIPRLGRVTLLAGENGVGKSTVLEAVHAYAMAGDPDVLATTLLNHEETSGGFNSVDGEPWPGWQSLFYGRKASRISIGACGSTRMEIENHVLSDDDFRIINQKLLPNLAAHEPALAIARGEKKAFCALIRAKDSSGSTTYPIRWGDTSVIEEVVGCFFMHPGIINPEITSSLWDIAARQSEEKNADKAVKILLGEDLDDIMMIGEAGPLGELRGHGTHRRRAAMAKVSAYPERVPLRSLGQGAVRLYDVALAFAITKNGFLLIDEADFGLHYTVQRDFWRMVLQTAQANNVQVLATTHSADCIRGFAEAATENKDAEGVLYRLSRKGGPLRAVEYDERELAIFAERMAELHLELR